MKTTKIEELVDLNRLAYTAYKHLDDFPGSLGDVKSIIKFVQALHPTPEAQVKKWVRSLDRLPERVDADAQCRVWVVDEAFGVVLRYYDDVTEKMTHIYPYWMSTGLAQPEPPTEETNSDE